MDGRGEEPLDKSKFVETIWGKVLECPKSWRIGQSVFNVIEKEFGVARDVQFLDGIDCFYVDDNIPEFIDFAWERYKKQKEDETIR